MGSLSLLQGIFPTQGGCVLDVAWKTGTSNGYRDAWCIAYTPDFTLGVWFGNPVLIRVGGKSLLGVILDRAGFLPFNSSEASDQNFYTPLEVSDLNQLSLVTVKQ